MDIKAYLAESFIARQLRLPDPALRAILLYGEDEGMITERGRVLAQAICPDLTDAFRVVDLPGAQLRDDPARLADEFQAMSMTGGRRVVRVRPAGDEATAAVQALFEAPAGDALILLEAGSLGPTSTLRKLVAGSERGAAIACYEDSADALEGLIDSVLGGAGLRADEDARAWLVDNLGSDRGLSRSELEKLALYKGLPDRDAPPAARTVTVDDAMAIVGDSAAIGLDDAVYAVFDGNDPALDRALDRIFAEGVAPAAAVRALQRHADQLHRATALVANGASPEDAMMRMRPPVHFARRSAFRQQLRIWTPHRIGDVLDRLLTAEIDCKTTGYPDEAIVRRVAVSIAQVARALARAPARR